MVAEAVDRFGRVDIIVNNAGILDPGSLPELTREAVARPHRRARAGRLQRHPRGVASAEGIPERWEEIVDESGYSTHASTAEAVAFRESLIAQARALS